MAAANTLLTNEEITNEALDVLENNLKVTYLVNRQYDDKFGREGAKIGDVVNARKPPRYIVSDGDTLVMQNTKETSVPVRLDKKKHIGMNFTDVERLLHISQFRERILVPAISQLANQIDQDVCAVSTQFYQAVGTPGTVPNALLTYMTAGMILDNNSCPPGMRNVCYTPKMQITIVDALKGLTEASASIAAQYTTGMIKRAVGLSWVMDQNCPLFQVGPLGGTPLVNGADQVGSSLITDAWTAAAAPRLVEGDIFTIDGVQSVNPKNRFATGELQQFRVTADVSSDGAGNLTAAIEPEIIISGAEQTVDSAPANNAALTILGAANNRSRRGFVFHRDAIVLVSADLPLHKNLEMSERAADDQVGLSLRMQMDYDIKEDENPVRVDVLYGTDALRKELGVQVCS